MEAFGPSSYGDAFADVYDSWYRDLPGTERCVEHLARAASGRPLLELGVGTGRLALPLARRGVEIVGLDSSKAMLDRLGAKLEGESIRLVCADMAAPPLRPAPFGIVVVAFNTLFNLGSREAQQRCLHAARTLLGDDGRLIVETVVFPDGDLPVKGVDASIVEVDRVVLTASRLDPSRREVVGQHIEITEAGTRLRPWLLHYLLPGELDAVARASGFQLESRAEGWDGEPFSDESRHQVAVYRPRA
jgi:SAM-dependent methyltransferase